MIVILKFRTPAAGRCYHRWGFAHKALYFYSSYPRDPFEVLGVKPTATYAEVRDAFMRLSKKFHPDVSKEPHAEAKFKEINIAYQALNERYFKDEDRSDYYRRSEDRREGSNDQMRDLRTDEEKLFEKIFGKNFESDPLAYYDPKNENLRKFYELEREKLRRSKNYEPTSSSSAYSSGWKYDKLRTADAAPKSAKSVTLSHRESQFLLGLFSILSLLGISIIFMDHHKSEKPSEANSEKIEEWRKKSIDDTQQKRQKIIDDFLKNQVNMKFYPRVFEPSAVEQLVDYTIFSDIKLYSVPYFSFYKDSEGMETGEMPVTKFRIPNFIKLNTLITLSLEAERCLKNTFVNINNLKKELEEKGTFSPPGIFFRYYGYIYFKIRRKPIVLENLDEKEEWISLFDLYFRYHSPLPFVNCDYFDFPVRLNRCYPENKKDFALWVGNVHMNHKPLPKIYLNGGEKNVFFWKGTTLNNQKELEYMMIWYHIYDKHHYRHAK